MDQSIKTITVLCSTYNSERWIDDYLGCINNQLLKTFEIIFVDANSNDTSLQTIKEFEFREGITKKIIECKERITVYEAWNKAIEAADSSYVINVNTDDRIFPAALSVYSAYALTSPDVDVFYGNCNIVTDEQHNELGGVGYWPEYSHEVLLQQCCCGPFPFLKRSTIVDEGMFDPEYTISGDYEMWLRLSKRGKKFLKIKETVGSYFFNPEGISTDPDKFEEHLRQDTKLRDLYA